MLALSTLNRPRLYACSVQLWTIDYLLESFDVHSTSTRVENVVSYTFSMLYFTRQPSSILIE